MQVLSKLMCIVLTCAMIALPGCRTREAATSAPRAIDFTTADWFKDLSPPDQERVRTLTDLVYGFFIKGGWEIYDLNFQPVKFEDYAKAKDKEDKFYIVSPKGEGSRLAFKYITRMKSKNDAWSITANAAIYDWDGDKRSLISYDKLTFNNTDTPAAQELKLKQSMKLFQGRLSEVKAAQWVAFLGVWMASALVISTFAVLMLKQPPEGAVAKIFLPAIIVMWSAYTFMNKTA